jgi:hypothetical protein
LLRLRPLLRRLLGMVLVKSLPRLVEGMRSMAQMLLMHLLLLLRMMELIRHDLLQGREHHLRA